MRSGIFFRLLLLTVVTSHVSQLFSKQPELPLWAIRATQINADVCKAEHRNYDTASTPDIRDLYCRCEFCIEMASEFEMQEEAS